jgi:hypothetical protein
VYYKGGDSASYRRQSSRRAADLVGLIPGLVDCESERRRCGSIDFIFPCNFLAVRTAVRRRHPERHHREGRVRESDPTPSWGWGLAPRALLDHPRLRDGRARVEPDHSEHDPEVGVVGVVDLIARDRDEGGRASYFTVKKVSW